MFDFAWSEIMLIGAVALIAIGPKDMPVAIRSVTGMIKKARRMAAEFQTHVDDLVREAELGGVKEAFDDLRRMDIASAVEKAVDPDRTIRDVFQDNPLESTFTTPAAGDTSAAEPGADEAQRDEPSIGEPGTAASAAAEPPVPAAPAFIPPNFVPRPPPAPVIPEAPAFIPPEVVLQRQHTA